MTLIAAVHYTYMCEYWMQVHKPLIAHRRVDWSIIVLLHTIDLTLIFKADLEKLLGKLSLGPAVMIALGYAGEKTKVIHTWTGFILGMVGWAYILHETFLDETLLDFVYDTADFINEFAVVLTCWSTTKYELEG